MEEKRVMLFKLESTGDEIKEYFENGTSNASMFYLTVDWLLPEDIAKLDDISSEIMEVYKDAMIRKIDAENSKLGVDN